ncbi:hypothetical protein DSUL_50458 [Desulfovibrionales bacterium]
MIGLRPRCSWTLDRLSLASTSSMATMSAVVAMADENDIRSVARYRRAGLKKSAVWSEVIMQDDRGCGYVGIDLGRPWW